LSNVEPVFGSLRPERTDSHAVTPSYVTIKMGMSLLVLVGGAMCRDAIVIGAVMGAVPTVAGPGSLNKNNN
jgi:hypothetical protein